MKIKICGMADADNIAHIGKMTPDYIGLIFYKSSPRFVGDGFSSCAVTSLPAKIKKVGVFVNEASPNIRDKITKYGLDLIQLHGDETPEQCLDLRKSAQIIKAFQIDAAFDFKQIANYVDHCDYFLFDTKSSGYGGSGKLFDHKLINNYTYKIPFFISGGLGPETIDQLLKLEHRLLHGIDFNSQLELSPGLKDLASTKIIIDKIRDHEKIQSGQ